MAPLIHWVCHVNVLIIGSRNRILVQLGIFVIQILSRARRIRIPTDELILLASATTSRKAHSIVVGLTEVHLLRIIAPIEVGNVVRIWMQEDAVLDLTPLCVHRDVMFWHSSAKRVGLPTLSVEIPSFEDVFVGILGTPIVILTDVITRQIRTKYY